MNHRHIENQLSEMTWDALEKGKGRKFISKFIEPGIIKYSDEKGQPYVALVKKETLDRFIRSMIGCPLIIKHHDVNKDTVEDLRAGIIADVVYNSIDGWYYAHGVVWDEDAIKKIEEEGWSVSCTYVITEEGEGGVYHDLKYDVEFLNGDFEHLALVENPRYEEATIVLNSKGEPIRKKKENSEEKCPKCGSTNIVKGKTLDICKDCDANIHHNEKEKRCAKCGKLFRTDLCSACEEQHEENSKSSNSNNNDNGGNAMFKKKSENEKFIEEVKGFLSTVKNAIDGLCKKVGNEKAKLLEPVMKAVNEAGDALVENAKAKAEDEDEKKKDKDNESESESENEAEDDDDKKKDKDNESEAEAESENESEDEDEEKDKKAKAKKKGKSAKNESDDDESDEDDELEKSRKAKNQATPIVNNEGPKYMTMEERLKLGKELF